MGGRRVTGDDASVDLEERVPTDPSSSAVEGARLREPITQPAPFLWAGLYERSWAGGAV